MMKISLIFILLLAACTTEPVEIHDDNAVLHTLLKMGTGTIEIKDCVDLPDSICVWEDGRITLLNCYNNSLTGGIPENIGKLTELTQLGLKSNDLKGEIPESIGDLINLTQLSFGYDSLSGNIPESIGKLKKLTLLDLSHNQLSGNIPKAIGELTALHTFLADSNNLSGTISDDFCTIFSNLINYDLSGNKFCPPQPSCIDNKNNIGNQNCDNACGDENTFVNDHCYSTADLSALGAFVKISSAKEDSLKLGKQEWHAGRLEILDCYWQDDEIDTCHLAGDIPANLGNLSALKYLNLQKSSLSGALPLSVGNLSKLEYLYLQDDSISGSLPETIGGMVNLKDFRIANNQLSGSIPVSIGNLSELINLNLKNN